MYMQLNNSVLLRTYLGAGRTYTYIFLSFARLITQTYGKPDMSTLRELSWPVYFSNMNRINIVLKKWN